jgi:hypothetical protein
MKFALWMRQEGGGCDYMIGCGQKIVFDADDLQAAQDECVRIEDENEDTEEEWNPGILQEHFNYNSGECKLSAAILFPLDGADVDIVKKFKQNIKAADDKSKEAERIAAAKQKEEHDKAEFERLKKKFEGIA